jgi:hypothetical protein
MVIVRRVVCVVRGELVTDAHAEPERDERRDRLVHGDAVSVGETKADTEIARDCGPLGETSALCVTRREDDSEAETDTEEVDDAFALYDADSVGMEGFGVMLDEVVLEADETWELLIKGLALVALDCVPCRDEKLLGEAALDGETEEERLDDGVFETLVVTEGDKEGDAVEVTVAAGDKVPRPGETEDDREGKDGDTAALLDKQTLRDAETDAAALLESPLE